MAIDGMNHFTVLSSDLDRTLSFYCGLLGMRRGPRPAIPIAGRWFYVGDQAVLHVLPRTAVAPVGPRPAGGPDMQEAFDHFALESGDWAAFEHRLRAAGQPFECQRLSDTDTWQVFRLLA